MDSDDSPLFALEGHGKRIDKVSRSPHSAEDPGFISASYPALVRLATPSPRKLPPDRAILPYSHFWYYFPQEDLE
jgi:hypothetical protein